MEFEAKLTEKATLQDILNIIGDEDLVRKYLVLDATKYLDSDKEYLKATSKGIFVLGHGKLSFDLDYDSSVYFRFTDYYVDCGYSAPQGYDEIKRAYLKGLWEKYPERRQEIKNTLVQLKNYQIQREQRDVDRIEAEANQRKAPYLREIEKKKKELEQIEENPLSVL